MNSINGNTVSYWLVDQVSAASGVPSTPVFTNIRRVGGSIGRNPSFTQSNEVDPTRQGAASILTQFEVSGTLDGEVIIGDPSFRSRVESVMQNTWSGDVGISASTISFDNASSEIRDSANGFSSLSAGQFIGVFNSGSQTEEVFYITSKTDNGTLVVNPAPVDESAGATVDIKADFITNDKIEKGLTIQERIPARDGSVRYNTYEGCQSTSMAFSVSASSILTITDNIIGLNKLDQSTAVAGQTDEAIDTSRILGAVNGVPSVFVDGVKEDAHTKCYSDISITIDNGGSGFYCVGGAGAGGIQYGAIDVTGSFTSLVDGTDKDTIATEQDKADNETLFGFSVVFKDADGNYLVIDRPHTQYDSFSYDGFENGSLLQNSGTVRSNGKGALGYTVSMTYIEKP